MSARVLVSIARGAAAALLFAGCLPGDTRPPPALIHFVVEPSAAVTGGVKTVDGWQITFEKLLVGLGGAGVDNGALCNRYANGGYERLFDFTVPGRQKLSDVYALGTCDLRFRLRSPGSDALLGQGVTAEDLAFMRLEEKDAVIPLGRKSIHVRGQATREGVTKRFEWSFRIEFRLRDCPDATGVGLASKVSLQGGDERTLSVRVLGEELFRERPSDESPLRFDAIAGADADGDQAITLEELLLASGPEPEADAGLTPGGDAGPPSIGHLLYFFHVPRMVRLGDGGACSAEDPTMRP